MKIPKQVSRYCPFCKKHTQHKVILFKTKPRPKTKKRALKWGVRHYAQVSSGHVGSVRPVVSPEKSSKKVAVRYECLQCKKSHFKQKTKRAKRVEQK